MGMPEGKEIFEKIMTEKCPQIDIKHQTTAQRTPRRRNAKIIFSHFQVTGNLKDKYLKEAKGRNTLPIEEQRQELHPTSLTPWKQEERRVQYLKCQEKKQQQLRTLYPTSLSYPSEVKKWRLSNKLNLLLTDSLCKKYYSSLLLKELLSQKLLSLHKERKNSPGWCGSVD